jgi:hypothetical protein
MPVFVEAGGGSGKGDVFDRIPIANQGAPVTNVALLNLVWVTERLRAGKRRATGGLWKVRKAPSAALPRASRSSRRPDYGGRKALRGARTRSETTRLGLTPSLTCSYGSPPTHTY